MFNKINTIGKSSTTLVPVVVRDNSNLFATTGTMSAQIQGYSNDVSILWEQITGDPVVFTSSLDSISISFDASDLSTKTFRCYTNKNTIHEQYDDGQFFHYPVDSQQINVDIISAQLIKESSPLHTNISINSWPSIANLRQSPTSFLEAQIIKYRATSSSEAPSVYTEIEALVEALKSYVIKTRVYTGNINNWVLKDEFIGYHPRFFGYNPSTFDNSIKIEFYVYYYGVRRIITISTDNPITENRIGAVAYGVLPNSIIHSSAVEYSITKSSYSIINNNESCKNKNTIISSGLIGYEYDLSTYTLLPDSPTDTTEMIYIIFTKPITHTYTLQNSTGVV